MPRIRGTIWLAPLLLGLTVPSWSAAHPSRSSRRTARPTHAGRPHPNSRELPARGVRSATAGALTRAHAATGNSSGTTYYVSPQGSDANLGTSPASAWRTVGRVDDASLEPGDEVLFEGGATFTDEALMPGWGTGASGTAGAPIVFGSYGPGEAALTQGVWFDGEEHLSFRGLVLGTGTGDEGHGFQGHGNGIVVLGLRIEHVTLGINAAGNGWTIVGNTIRDTGDSGMLLGYTANAAGDPAGGSNYVVSRNTVSDTGLDPAIPYGTHGIYDKVADSLISENTISDFRDDGVSARYRDSTIYGNHISDGEIGLAWFQYDVSAGSSSWTGNVISDVDTGIFVCSEQQGCLPPIESFHFEGNAITARSPSSSVPPLDAPSPVSAPAVHRGAAKRAARLRHVRARHRAGRKTRRRHSRRRHPRRRHRRS